MTFAINPERKKSISGKTFNPKMIGAMAADVRRVELGVIMGKADGVTKTEGRDGEVLEGLKGMFVFKSFHPNVNPDAAANTLWTPSGFPEETFILPRDGKPVEFAYKVTVERADNPAGYSWSFAPLMPPSEHDPMQAMIARMAEASPALVQLAKAEVNPALEDKSGEVIEGKADAKHKAK